MARALFRDLGAEFPFPEFIETAFGDCGLCLAINFKHSILKHRIRKTKKDVTEEATEQTTCGVVSQERNRRPK